MLTIPRYVVGEVLKVFVVALAVMTLITTLCFAVRDGLREGLPPELMVRSMPFMLPEMLGITVPVGILFAVSNVFARISGSNELLALKSCGISPMAIVWPVLILGVAVSLGAFWLYDLAATWGRPNVERIVIESVAEIAYGRLRTGRSYHSPEFSIVVKGVRGRKLLRPVITLNARGDRPALTVTAEEAELWTSRSRRAIVIRCRSGEVDIAGRGRLAFQHTIEQVIPFRTPEKRVHRDWLSVREIPEYVAQTRAKVYQIEQRLGSDATLRGKARQSVVDELRRDQHRVYRLQSEPYRRWSNAFSCLCFALVGVPVAMQLRSDNALTSFFLCFLPILGVYYPLLMLGEDLSTSGTLPPISFWTGNLVLAIAGGWLLRRAIRY
jgi:lipopolysaccharide export system permease protein